MKTNAMIQNAMALSVMVSTSVAWAHNRGPISFTKFVTAANEAVQYAGSGDDCTFTVTGEQDGVKLEVKEGSKVVTLNVGARESIQYIDKSKADDNVYEYITEQGSLTTEYTDDAFNRVELNAHGDSATCEVDM